MSTETYGGYFLNSYRAPSLENFVNLSLQVKPLGSKYGQIMNYFLKNPGNTPNIYYESYKDSLTNQRTTSRHTKSLHDKGLLELVTETQELIKGMKSKYKNPYRLSLSGIFYLILNTCDITYDDLVLYLLKNYKDNILFTAFLYPFLTCETLLEADWDSAFFSIVVPYLRDICKVIINSVDSLGKMCNTTDDGYLSKQVFIWHNNPSNNYPQNFFDKNLRNYLGWTLGWDWIEDATITPKPNENIIEILDVSDTQRKLTISILKDENKAVLRQYGTKLYEFSINPDGSFLSIEAKTPRKTIDFIEMPFVYSCKEHMIGFLTKLRTQITPFQPYYGNLHEDETFKKALEYLDKESKVKV